MESLAKLFHSRLNEEVYASGQLKSIPAGTTIANIQTYFRSVPIVLSGCIKVLVSDDHSREILLYSVHRADGFFISFLGGTQTLNENITAKIEEDTEVLLIPIVKTIEWTREFPEWTNFVLQSYQKRCNELINLVSLVAFERVETRLYHLLTQKSSLFHSSDIIITHQKLANELGMTRESVSRVLKIMEREKRILLHRNKISIL